MLMMILSLCPVLMHVHLRALRVHLTKDISSCRGNLISVGDTLLSVGGNSVKVVYPVFEFLISMPIILHTQPKLAFSFILYVLQICHRLMS